VLIAKELTTTTGLQKESILQLNPTPLSGVFLREHGRITQKQEIKTTNVRNIESVCNMLDVKLIRNVKVTTNVQVALLLSTTQTEIDIDKLSTTLQIGTFITGGIRRSPGTRNLVLEVPKIEAIVRGMMSRTMFGVSNGRNNGVPQRKLKLQVRKTR
jgi:hypothetical protein